MSYRIFKSVFFFFITLNASAQVSFNYNTGKDTNNENWKYHHGDDMSWADPDYDDTLWDSIQPSDYSHEMNGFQSIAWFRSSFYIYDSINNNSLTFLMKHKGASEIYLDGKLIKKFGVVSSDPRKEEAYNSAGEPVYLAIEEGLHYIAVRYSNHHAENNLKTFAEDLEGFKFEIFETEDTLEMYKTGRFFYSFALIFSIGFFFTLSLLHFAIFLFYKRERSNLYYTLFTLALALYFGALLGSQNISIPFYALLFNRFAEVLGLVQSLSLLALVYSFTYTKIPKRYWIFFSLAVLCVGIFFFKINLALVLSNLIQVTCYIDCIRLIILRLLKKYPPSQKTKKWLKYILIFLMIGLIALAFVNIIIPLVIIGILLFLLVLPLVASIFVIPIYMSIRHARSFSTANKNLEAQLVRVQELSAKSLEQEKEKKKIIEAQKEQLEIQVAERTQELSQKNNEITDSINYAKRIQSAILPPLENIQNAFPCSFVLFMPKDIVSGDFYWFLEKEDGYLIAAADCTGHGVPGAFMSVISSEKLSGAAQQSSHVSDILNITNRGIKESLRQSENEGSTRDGMDICICNFDKQFKQVTYSGANRPLWLIRKNSNVITDIKATKTAIGGLTSDDQKFDSNMLQLSEGDTLYLFTDGFADQFSAKDKKLMTKKFKEVLLSIQDKVMDEQKMFLDSFIKEWKGNMEQTDDILVIGIRV
jgi:serine phosphatase RsbU (regulator of sigma subunit)